jgi:pimeloyl-ACP methyl ester carboxylesterase
MSAKLRTAALAASIIVAGAFVISLLSGILYEQAQRSRDRERFPQIGRSVDIGGRTLTIDCAGVGRPAVILESGATWTFYDTPKAMFENGAPRPGFSWVQIQSELAKSTTTCWFDRAGSGWSDLGPYPRDSASQARDLHALLAAAGVPSPYVLVAESSAALDARVYARLYPDGVAGVVLVNGLHPDFFGTRVHGKKAQFPEFLGHSQDVAAQLFNRIGLYRLVSTDRPVPSPPPAQFTTSQWNTIWHLAQSVKARSALLQDIASWQQSAAQARLAANLGGRPLIVLSGETSPAAPQYRDLWMKLQTDQTRLSTQAKQIIVRDGSGDLIYQAPGAIVEGVRQVIDDVRRNGGQR